MGNIDCAYCCHSFSYYPDEGIGQDERAQIECPKCEKTFTAVADYSLTFYSARRAPCLNGEPHDFKRANIHLSESFPEWVRCAGCGEEKRGKYVAREEKL